MAETTEDVQDILCFSRKLRCVLRLCCPLTADNSTLTPRKVFSATHMSRQKTNRIAFASADAKLCEAFLQTATPGKPGVWKKDMKKSIRIYSLAGLMPRPHSR